MSEEQQVIDPHKQRIRHAVRMVYDLQKLRINAGGRGRHERTDEAQIELRPEDQRFFEATTDELKKLEKKAASYVARALKGYPLWEEYLSDQPGCGPLMAALIISSVDIRKADTISALWAYCGLSVTPEGTAVRPIRGQKLTYNPVLKTKLLQVLADSFIKQALLDGETGRYYSTRGGKDPETRKYLDVPPWRKLYDDRKVRRMNQRVHCTVCDGTGEVTPAKAAEYNKKVGDPEARRTDGICWSCDGEGVGPWGNSPAHRDRDARRYMIKIFLQELWMKWRELEGLPVTAPYAEVYLDRPHGSHGGPSAHA